MEKHTNKTSDIHESNKKTGAYPEDKVDELLQAFELFCQETGRLEGAYTHLKNEFHIANLELEKINTELNQKVIELHKLTSYLENILTHIAQGLIFIDLSETIILFNPAASHIFSQSKKQLQGKKFSKLFPDTLFGFSLKNALQEKIAPRFTRLSYASGPKQGERLLDIEADFLLIPGEANGLIITVRDMTELKRLEILANRNDRMKELGLLAAEVAHEIRNPLGGIKGFASLLKRDLRNQPELEKMANYIIEGTDQLNELVSQVLDYSRPVEPHFSIISIKELINEVIDLVILNTALTPKPQFDVKIEPEELKASLDPYMTKSAILNLIVNSIQAMPEGGVLLFKGKIEKNQLILEICDTGPGIPKENREKIFSPFFTTKIEGNGFGLAEVHKVVLAQGGQIDLVTHQGKGAHFRIIIPQKV